MDRDNHPSGFYYDKLCKHLLPSWSVFCSFLFIVHSWFAIFCINNKNMQVV